MNIFNLCQNPPQKAKLSVEPAWASNPALGVARDTPLTFVVTFEPADAEIESVRVDLVFGDDAEMSVEPKKRESGWSFGKRASDFLAAAKLGSCDDRLMIGGKVKGKWGKPAVDFGPIALEPVPIFICSPRRVELVQGMPARALDRVAWEQVKKGTERFVVPEIDKDFDGAKRYGPNPFQALRQVVEESLAKTLRLEATHPGLRKILDRQLGALDTPTDLSKETGNNPRLPPPSTPESRGAAGANAVAQGPNLPSTPPFPLLLDRPYFCELIHSFWLEVAMIAQGIKMIAFRFQNLGADQCVAKLGNLNVFYLRPIAGLLWDFLARQHEVRTVRGRVHAGYLAELDCVLPGRAAQPIRPVQRNGSFSAAFHGLLHVAMRYYAQFDDKAVHADGFAVLQALRTFSDVLKRTEMNTFGRIAFDARREFATYGWMLQQPEIRRFLVSEGIPAKEPWLPAVDALNALCGWRVGPALYYYDLAVEGERLLASVRWLDWDSSGPSEAADWALFWRQNIQTYVYRMRLVTGLDLASDEKEHIRDHALPMSTLVYRRLGIAA